MQETKFEFVFASLMISSISIGVTDRGNRGSQRSPRRCYIYYRNYNIILNYCTVMIFFHYLEFLKEMPYLSSPLSLRDATSRIIALTLSTRAVLCVPLLLHQCERYVVSLLSFTLVRCRIPRLGSGLKIILKNFIGRCQCRRCCISLHFFSIPDFLDMWHCWYYE